MHFVFVFFAFSCSIVFDKVFMAKSSCCYQSGRGKALRYIGRFELKFAALSLIQSYLNRPCNGKNTPKSYGMELSPPPPVRKMSTASRLFLCG